MLNSNDGKTAHVHIFYSHIVINASLLDEGRKILFKFTRIILVKLSSIQGFMNGITISMYILLHDISI